ncbi:DUF2442 domain-containing protein [Bradyrhizobium sp. SZCCHNR1018]|uniref:DUF2442 domain-containing protein n=1 Tax=unclassified Bradyrhizobium TaxID=2631580 RepID=UPI0039655ECE
MPQLTCEDHFDPLIARADADFGRKTLHLTWTDGRSTVVDFSELVGKGVFVEFQNEDFFRSVSITDGGRILAWPGGIDLDALSLWCGANPAETPEALKPFVPPANKAPFAPRTKLVSNGFG